MTIANNNKILFTGITRKKSGVFVNFKVVALKGGTTCKSSISVDLSSAEVDLSDPMEEIIEHCAKIATKDFKRSEIHFEPITAI